MRCHLAGTAGGPVIAHDKPGSSALYRFQFLYVGTGVGVPGSGGILNGGSYQACIAVGFDVFGTSGKVPSEEAKSVTCPLCDGVHMCVPRQIVSECDPKVLP